MFFIGCLLLSISNLLYNHNLDMSLIFQLLMVARKLPRDIIEFCYKIYITTLIILQIIGKKWAVVMDFWYLLIIDYGIYLLNNGLRCILCIGIWWNY